MCGVCVCARARACVRAWLVVIKVVDMNFQCFLFSSTLLVRVQLPCQDWRDSSRLLNTY
jgi:hypothetical protein